MQKRLLNRATALLLAVGLALTGTLTLTTPAAAAAPAVCAGPPAGQVSLLGSRSINLSNGHGGSFTGHLDWEPSYITADLSAGRLKDTVSTSSDTYLYVRWRQGYQDCNDVRWEPNFSERLVRKIGNGGNAYPVSWTNTAPWVRDVHFDVCTYKKTSPAGWRCSGWG